VELSEFSSLRAQRVARRAPDDKAPRSNPEVTAGGLLHPLRFLAMDGQFSSEAGDEKPATRPITDTRPTGGFGGEIPGADASRRRRPTRLSRRSSPTQPQNRTRRRRSCARLSPTRTGDSSAPHLRSVRRCDHCQAFEDGMADATGKVFDIAVERVAPPISIEMQCRPDVSVAARTLIQACP